MSSKASVSLKKKDGFLTTSDDRTYLFYTPAAPPGASPSVTIPIADITNLQQTPATNPKIALKVSLKDNNYVFNFTHANNAREEQVSITQELSNAIAAIKSASNRTTVSRTDTPAEDSGRPAALAIASAASSRAEEDSWYDDKKLKADTKLQQQLIDTDPILKARFTQALKDKPDSVSVTQFNAQFWSTRLHLLRSYAIEKAQERGEYNVLPEIRWTLQRAEKEGEPDRRSLSILKSQVRLIFKQYPVVRDAYNENVPPLKSDIFWTRLFSSRLLKKLKGEKITPQDPHDDVFDKYLDRRETAPASLAHIPNFIDLEGNEQNHSQRKGNRPDETMRPSSFQEVPILRILNNLSESILSHVAPEDGEAHAPIGVDEETFEQLRLRDLADEETDNRVVLNIREQQKLIGSADQDSSAEARLYAKQVPAKVLSSLNAQLGSAKLGGEHGAVRLDELVHFNADADSDEDDEEMEDASEDKPVKQSLASATGAATSAMFNSVKHRREAAVTDPKSLNGLSQSTFDAVTTTQNTTIEFLHYFWTVFLSGDASRAGELAQLVNTLDRSLERIKDVGETANQERQRHIDRQKAQLQEYQQRTGKKRKYDFDSIGGGSKVVDAMFKPTIGAIKQAEIVYRRALLEEQTGQNGGTAVAA